MLLQLLCKDQFNCTAQWIAVGSARAAMCSFFLVAACKMTTETSSRGDIGVISARRTESCDVSDIIGLFSNTTDVLFGRIDVVYLL